MKDINGKRLRRGDVVMFHIEDERCFGKVTVIDVWPEMYSDKKHFSLTNTKTGKRWMEDIEAEKFVEIIGNVRETKGS